jgi:hypothetical protein
MGPIFFLQHFKQKYCTILLKFVATLKGTGYDIKFFLPLSFVAVFGSEIRDPGWVKIRIRDKHPRSATLICKVQKVGLVLRKGVKIKTCVTHQIS